MSTPRFYSWDDDGSPGRALSGNLQNRLKQILVPCLVTGYGSKPGAGWTLEHEHANGFTVSNGDAYVNFVSNLPANAPYPAMHTGAIHLYVAESLTNTSAAVIQGANLCSGSYRAGAAELVNWPRHSLRVKDHLQDQLASLQWTVLADDGTAVLSFSLPGSSSTFYLQFTVYLGNTVSSAGLDKNVAIFGGDNTSYNTQPTTSTLCRGFTTPRNLLTGLSEYAITTTQPFESKYNSYAHADIGGPVPENINLQAPRIAVNDGYAGRLRGVVYDDILNIHGWPVWLRALGFSGSDFSDRGKVLTIGGYEYAYAIGYGGGFIMTTDPAFW